MSHSVQTSILDLVTDTHRTDEGQLTIADALTPADIAARIAAMSNRELADVIEGRTRIGDTQAEQLTAWNLAIDEESDRS